MKTTDSKAEPKVEETAELTPLAYAVPGLVPAKTLAWRPEAAAYFVAHLVAVAAITAAGAVVALATITLAVVLAPLTLALFAGALWRRDRLLTARALV
jgi:hypothetical protein